MANVDDGGLGQSLSMLTERALRHITDLGDTQAAVPINFGYAFTVPVAVPTTTGTVFRMRRLPPGAYLLDFRGTPSDMDSGTALVYDIVLVDDAGTTKTTLVSGSTKGQAGTASDRILDAAVGKFCGNQILAIKVTTQSTGASAGTYKVFLQFCIGIISPTTGDVAMTDVGI